MIDQRTFECLKKANVKLGLDTILCLAPITFLEARLADAVVYHPIRTLAELRVDSGAGTAPRMVIHDPIAAELADWSRGRVGDFRKIMGNLEMIATHAQIENPNILKPVRHKQAKGLSEVTVKNGQARLFVFQDPHDGKSLVATGTYIKRGNVGEKELKKQDQAILRAAERRDLWIQAAPIAGLTTWRVLRRGN